MDRSSGDRTPEEGGPGEKGPGGKSREEVSSESLGTESTTASRSGNVVIDPNTWVEDYGDYLFRFALQRVGKKDVAEELVQETLLAAWKGLGNFQGKSSIKTWMVTILKNKIMDHYRKAGRKKEVSESEFSDNTQEGFENLFNRLGIWRTILEEWKGTPEGLIEQQGFLDAFRSCLECLPDRMRRVFTLRAVEGVPTNELCEELSITENNLWVILYRARMQLRTCIESNWFKRL